MAANTLEHINPASMHKNPAFSQGIVIPAGARILVIGGQNAVDETGEVVGKGDIAAQTTKAVENLITVLEAAGGSLDDLVRVGRSCVQTPTLRRASGPGWPAPAAS